MADEQEPLLPAGLALQLLDALVAELLDLAAVEAQHVIVMVVPQHVLVHELALPGVERREELALEQHRQRAIHGRARDLRPGLLLEPFVQPLRAEVLVRLERAVEDAPALRRELERPRAQEALETPHDLLLVHRVLSLSACRGLPRHRGVCPVRRARPSWLGRGSSVLSAAGNVDVSFFLRAPMSCRQNLPS